MSMIPVWKLSRTAPARRVYDALVAAGIRISILDRFHRDLGRAEGQADIHASGVTIEVHHADACPFEWGTDDPGLESDHLVIGAVVDGSLVGITLLSLGGPVYVEPLERTMTFEGGYIWGVKVAPDWRREGIASALVAAALEELEDAGVTGADALIAPDNQPSRALFRSSGFSAAERHIHLSAFGFEHRSTRDHLG